MKKILSILFLGGPKPAMEKRIEKFLDYMKVNSDCDFNIVTTGLYEELSFFHDKLKKEKIVPKMVVFSWDTVSNIIESKDFLDEVVIISTGHWHGKRVLRICENLGYNKIEVVDSGEKEPFLSSRILYILYYNIQISKLMCFIARKIRVKWNAVNSSRFFWIKKILAFWNPYTIILFN